MLRTRGVQEQEYSSQRLSTGVGNFVWNTSRNRNDLKQSIFDV